MSIDFESIFGENGRKGQSQRRSPRRLWIWILVIFTLFSFSRFVLDLYIDWLWFESLDQSAVLRTRWLEPIRIFALVAIPGWAWLAFNWRWAAGRLAARANFPGQTPPGWLAGPAARPLLIGLALALASSLAVGASSAWQRLLLFGAGGQFDVVEPILGKDVGFYVFQLPVWQLLQALSLSMIVVAFVGSAAIYLAGGAAEAGGQLRRELLKPRRSGAVPTPSGRSLIEALRPARAHLMALAACYALATAAGTWLARFALLSGERQDRVFAGPGFADVSARLPALSALTALWILAALILIIGMRFGRVMTPVAVVLGVAILRLLGGGVWPDLVQQYRVKPNEQVREKPFIEHGIQLTRAAWALDAIQEVDYQPGGAVTPDLLAENAATLDNVRLWDWQVLLDFLDQKQSIRPYYDFLDVDIDRYATEEGMRQVELSARELNPAGLSNPTWISRHLEYTHGYGLAMAPVDEVDSRGQPVLWARDLPLRVSEAFGREVTEPRIYFGEGVGVPYVIVGTRTDEFDYPLGDENARTKYAGSDGVRLGSGLRRLAFAMHFGDIEILLSDDVSADSRVLMQRNVAERARSLAPFLIFDDDPYLVVDDAGRLVWIIDAYTASDRYPYSQPLRLGGAPVNYLRNSVKVVIDAYEGQPSFYVVDPSDPIIRAWQAVFPSLFESADAMPADLVAHWRYPETLFRAQSQIFTRYHVERAEVFYNGEDLWGVPMETRGQGDTQPVEPYYVTMRLRDAEEPEFLLMLPYVPAGKKNMIAWLAARSDPGHYGQLVLYNFGKGRQVDGPEQIESRIDNSTDISAELTLWSQAGSRTIRGNLLVIPMGDALLYVEPLYLQAESNALPELKRVIVADGDRVEMRRTLEEALAALVDGAVRDAFDSVGVGDEGSDADAAVDADVDAGVDSDADAGADPDADPEADSQVEAAPPTPRPGLSLSDTPLPPGLSDLVDLARQHQAAAGRALEAGDWRRFGEEMAALDRILDALGDAAVTP